MSKFNSTVKSKPDCVNLAGGAAYKQSPKLEIASILLTNMCDNSFYEKESDAVERLKTAYNKLPLEDKSFMAKASIYARNEFRMRSITHIASNIILDDMKTNRFPWAKSFFEKVAFRPDDMAEIISCYWKDGKKPLPKALRSGFASAFNKFDDYQIAKYKMNKHEVSLIDIVRLVHPKPISKNSKALEQLVKGELKQVDTWNAKLSEAGKKATTEKEKIQNKAEVWEDFVNKGEKIEMFALLRNLKNILEQGTEETLDKALKLLSNPKLVKNSKILPFRFLTAWVELERYTVSNSKLAKALAEALEHSVSNVPEFSGSTLIALDASGSMFNYGTMFRSPAFNPKELFASAAVFAAALYKSNAADICLFSSDSKLASNINPLDSVITIVRSLYEQAQRCGTTFESIFNHASKKYDRIIILSDEQSWCGSTKRGFKNYKQRMQCSPKIYNIDVRGYGSLQFPEANCYCLAGISEKIFDLMSITEQDPATLVHTIEQIEL